MNRFVRNLGLVVGVAGCSLTPAAPPPDADDRSAVLGDVLAARYAELSDDAPIAAERLYRALELNPGDAVLLDRTVAAALAADDVGRAIDAARLGDRAGAASATARLVLAVAALENDRPEEAAKRLETAGGAAFERLAAQALRAHALAAANRPGPAVDALVNTTRPAEQILSFTRGMVLERLGRFDEALAAYAVAGDGEVRLAAANERRARLLARLGRVEEAKDLLNRELARLDNPGLQDLADRLARGESIVEPSNTRRDAAESLFALSMTFLATVEPAAATPYLALAARLDPENDVARVALGETLASGGLAARARVVLEGTPQASPYRASALVSLAGMLQDEGRGGEAAALLAPAAATGGDRIRRAYGDILRSEEQWSEAEAVYRDLVAKADARGRPDWRLFFSLGVTLERQGRWPESEVALARALELSPDQPDVLNYLGYSWVDRGERLEDGLKLIERAVALRPNSGAIVDSLGWAHYRRGEFDKALVHLERAVSLSPDDVTINDHLGDLYWRLGRRIEARYQWRRALSLKPTGAERQAIERKLAQGLDGAAPARADAAPAAKTP